MQNHPAGNRKKNNTAQKTADSGGFLLEIWQNNNARICVCSLLASVCTACAAAGFLFNFQGLCRAVAADDGARDTVEAADALADLIYVIYGMALETGIDLASVLAEVQRSNMSKLGADGKPVYREDGKVLKGPDYFPPNVEAVLRSRRLR